jgi:hypothetical protein
MAGWVPASSEPTLTDLALPPWLSGTSSAALAWAAAGSCEIVGIA